MKNFTRSVGGKITVFILCILFLVISVGGGIGIDAMEVIRFTLGYDYGLMDKMDNLKSKTGDIRIGVAYLF